jgi:hypothetical protein
MREQRNYMNMSLGIKATAISLVVALTSMTVSPLVVMAAPNNAPATDHSPTVTAGEVQQALQYTPDVLHDSTQTATTSDTDSAIQAATAGATIDVPKDASQGVTLAADQGPSLDIQLPNADQSGDAQQIAPGIVAYSSNDGAANAVQATEDGGVRMLTVIDNPTAPTTYDYKVTVPGGGRIELTEDGGAIVLDSNNQPISTVSTPWARDARGKRIRTWFTTDGITLTQHIKHNVRGVVYPVVGDPRFSFGWTGVTIYLSRAETNTIAWAVGGVGVYFGWTGIGGAAAYALPPAAQWATSHGFCMAVYISWITRMPITWVYRC